MTAQPHPDRSRPPIACGIVTISDSRTVETDRSGQTIYQLLEAAGHSVTVYQILPDEPAQITALLQEWGDRADLQVAIFNGGTGIANRDTTYEALSGLLEKELPGFGEIFRWLSYQEIGSRAIASRAIAGTYKHLLIFSLPGSQGAVTLGTSQLILPELNHLVKQLSA
jgi:molybdopterin adenylyltransferase